MTRKQKQQQQATQPTTRSATTRFRAVHVETLVQTTFTLVDDKGEAVTINKNPDGSPQKNVVGLFRLDSFCKADIDDAFKKLEKLRRDLETSGAEALIKQA